MVVDPEHPVEIQQPVDGPIIAKVAAASAPGGRSTIRRDLIRPSMVVFSRFANQRLKNFWPSFPAPPARISTSLSGTLSPLRSSGRARRPTSAASF